MKISTINRSAKIAFVFPSCTSAVGQTFPGQSVPEAHFSTFPAKTKSRFMCLWMTVGDQGREIGIPLVEHSARGEMNISWPMVPGKNLRGARIEELAEQERFISEKDLQLKGKPREITPNYPSTTPRKPLR